MKVKLIKNGQFSATNDTFEAGVSGAEQLLSFHAPGSDITYAIVDEADRLLASVTNRRILGTYVKQVWGGRKGDDAIDVGEVEFDATDYVLKMSHEDLQALEDQSDSSDEVGEAHVEWDDAHYVNIEDSICAYFGVATLDAITPEALHFASKRAKALAVREEVLTLSVKVRIRVTGNANVDDFVRHTTCAMLSRTEGIKVVEVENPIRLNAD
jgi:hypothetical protein